MQEITYWQNNPFTQLFIIAAIQVCIKFSQNIQMLTCKDVTREKRHLNRRRTGGYINVTSFMYVYVLQTNDLEMCTILDNNEGPIYTFNVTFAICKRNLRTLRNNNKSIQALIIKHTENPVEIINTQVISSLNYLTSFLHSSAKKYEIIKAVILIIINYMGKKGRWNFFYWRWNHTRP